MKLNAFEFIRIENIFRRNFDSVGMNYNVSIDLRLSCIQDIEQKYETML